MGAGLRGREWKEWYVSWATIWSRHIEGKLASQESLQHIESLKICHQSLTYWEELCTKPPHPKKSKSKSKLIIRASLYHGPLPFLPTHISFASYTIIRCWTMLVDYVGLKIRLLGTSPMVYLAIFPWCKPKWSCDKFNNHSYVSLGQRHSPWCKQPMSFKGKKM